MSDSAISGALAGELSARVPAELLVALRLLLRGLGWVRWELGASLARQRGVLGWRRIWSRGCGLVVGWVCRFGR